jgi:hypothetical protein
MSEVDPFETRFAAAYRRYLAEAPVEADPVAVARRVAAAAPRRQGLAGLRPFGLTPALAWVVLLAGLLLALVVGGLVVGARRPDLAVVIAPQTTPTPATSTSPWGTPAPAGSMTTARIWHTATLLPDGGVLIAGGWDGSKDYSASAELFDPATGRFGPTGPMTTARSGHTATLLADGRVLIAGGNDSSTILASAGLYDPATGTFSPTGSMSSPLLDHTATLLPDGRVLIAGGGDGPKAEIYDPTTGTFRPTGSMTTTRQSPSATLLPDGRVLIAGGHDPNPSNATGSLVALASAELYDPATGTFSPTGSMFSPRLGHTATLLPDGRVLIAGGGGGSKDAASAELFDPKTGTFGPTGSLVGPTGSMARSDHTATLLPDGRVLIAGGVRPGPLPPAVSAVLYDPATGTFSPTGSMSSPRADHTATLLPDGRVLIAGGQLNENPASAEVFDPVTGTFAPAGP